MAKHNWHLTGNAIVNTLMRKSWDATQISMDYFHDTFMKMSDSAKWKFVMEKLEQLDGTSVCPRCHYAMDPRRPALSRLTRHDDMERIYVCSDCGVQEAILQFHNNGIPVDWRK